MYNVIHKHIGAIMNIKKNGIDIDDAGIMSVFFEDEKIVSMSIDIDLDGLMSTVMLANAPFPYELPLYRLVHAINHEVLIRYPSYVSMDCDSDSYKTAMQAIRAFTDTYEVSQYEQH